MRVTQSMLSNNTLRHITNSYSRLGTLNDQLITGKKFTKPSDNPVAAMRAMGYRTDLNRIEQYQQNIGEVKSWVDTTDDALNHVVLAMQKVRELTVQASNGTLEESQRSYVATEIEQLKEQISNIGDSQIGGKYIFGGTKTDQKPSENDYAGTGSIEVEVFNGIKLPVNTEGGDLFPSIVGTSTSNGVLSDLIDTLNDETSTSDDINAFLGKLDEQIDNLLKERASIGARQNRVELMEDRLDSQEVFSTRILSDNEDIDLERTIIDLTSQESVHRAAMAAGAKIIQPTLMDFLR
ncbi:flagellar hook-associated protein FlgL [Bacillus sp. JJ722]|uniref:flagellar hook-associated protein FlgL n=1 Tax=Bacillus sp. JJ722 TaxID=3122973 RepID=UPI002FFF8EB7